MIRQREPPKRVGIHLKRKRQLLQMGPMVPKLQPMGRLQRKRKSDDI
jgi:hypothetical protein